MVKVLSGKFLSMNLGNFLPSTSKFTYSLADKRLAYLINKKIIEIDADIIVTQEIWNFQEEVFGKQYESIGMNDSIAVKKSFGKIESNTFKSNAFRFKISQDSPIYPNIKIKSEVNRHRERLLDNPYHGEKDSAYGIPADFDVSSVKIRVLNSNEHILVLNVHVHSSPKNDKIRSDEIEQFITNKVLNYLEEESPVRILIGGDFNQDERRTPNTHSAKGIKSLLNIPGMNDASINNREFTTNYPILKRRFDHIMGNAEFSNYTIQQSLNTQDYQNLRKKHPLTFWMYLDHKNISVDFLFR